MSSWVLRVVMRSYEFIEYPAIIVGNVCFADSKDMLEGRDASGQRFFHPEGFCDFSLNFFLPSGAASLFAGQANHQFSDFPKREPQCLGAFDEPHPGNGVRQKAPMPILAPAGTRD
ncbi:MAG: hypothetical protein V1913_13855 [Fibrobacterota bacterium]